MSAEALSASAAGRAGLAVIRRIRSALTDFFCPLLDLDDLLDDLCSGSLRARSVVQIYFELTALPLEIGDQIGQVVGLGHSLNRITLCRQDPVGKLASAA